jgi:hypothetical protein
MRHSILTRMYKKSITQVFKALFTLKNSVSF